MTLDTSRRLQAVDTLRGLVMIIMALDHTRDFFHVAAMLQQPTDLTTTTPLLFFTRWITHLCAPVFVLLAGTSARLWLARPGRTEAQLSRFLWTRGLWLIVVEIVVMRVAFDLSFDPSFPVLLLTLFALGGSMIILAALIHLPMRVMAALSLATILLHNAFDGVRATELGALSPLWTMLHQPGAIVPAGVVIVVGYPLVPWFAVMAMGYCLGEWLQSPPEIWRPRLLRLGAAITVLFVVVRGVNVYGDPSAWSRQDSAAFTLLSFLNTTKYPPSLSFLLMTLGPALMLLSAFGGRTLRDANPLVVFGRVPLFYFVGHFLLVHLLLVVATLARYGSAAMPYLLHAPPSMGSPKELFPVGFGYSLGTTYAVWVLAVVLMYPLCRWFGQLRARNTHWILSYL
ncbi:MAG: heparan-alpha-glucosaminide N-acetyltransferase domain-containing protein [Gemmatimonadota bacterium]